VIYCRDKLGIPYDKLNARRTHPPAMHIVTTNA